MREQRNIELGEEIKGRWLGPVPLKEFLLEFLPLPKDAPAKKEICFKYIAAAGSKAQIAARFVEAANKAALPRLSFVNTATSGKSSYDSEKLGPDVTAVSDATRIRYGGSPDEGEERKTYVDFGYSDLIVEVKGKKTDDAFNDLPATTQDAKEVDEQEEVNESEESAKEVEVEDQETVKGNRTKKALKKSEPLPFERDTNAACATRGQLATYTAAQSGAQFRTHSFSLFIFGPCARLIRWDRSCALVSERFEYGKSPNNYLADFLHRYSLLDDKGRGKDPTLSGSPSSAGSQAGGKVAPVAPGECPPGMEEELHSSNALNPKKGPRKTELRRILIPDRDNPEAVHPHIISYPLPFVARSPFGRATRPFLAYNPATDRIVFVKDYWRSTTLGISKEGDIYKKLKDNNVRHVPPFGHGNDIPGQQTIDLSKYKWVTEVPDTLQHYRMSLKVVGDSLKDFPSTKILVSAVADAMEGEQPDPIVPIYLLNIVLL
ncbi:hypothetical protein EST38_g13563 [Candolleomyces aberdarensis]|uniref:Fungal-type protein kinase domain-containing protein n=1 Tax=Candolleomyces aberdarensis TaxID=2316362 RepID=A0A4Q2CZM0_9AGAR|nr:hypothetical protein EST38_g13563 [Candolleomyces aberdarensis]